MGVQWFQERGLAFAYPVGWSAELGHADDANALPEATAYHPSGAFWSAAMHAPGADLEGLVQAAVEALESEYDRVEVDRISESIFDRPAVGFDAAFLSLDLTNTARLRCIAYDHATYVVYCQCEDRDLPAVDESFREMTESLLEHAVDEDDDEPLETDDE